MATPLAALEPQAVWHHFENLNAVPRPSKKEGRVIAFMIDFGRSLGLETLQDETGNVLIRKPASPGMEGRTPVVLQAHLDMVHQKNDGTDFDFDSEGIRMWVDKDWVRARGTTLGADNGLGVAAIMAVLEASDLAHPPLEALFTIDEETGMTGAKNLGPDWLQGRILLNLDTEEDDELDVGCAGGVDLTATGTYTPEPVPAGGLAFRLQVSGLQGGHSGMDIHKGLGNANKILTRLLMTTAAQAAIRLSRFEGGNLRNAIPRESHAILVVAASDREALEMAFAREAAAIQADFAPVEPGLELQLEPCQTPENVMPVAGQEALLRCLAAVHNGVQYMSYQFPEQTETSNNLARVLAGAGEILIGCLTRSSSESRKADLVRSLQAVFGLAGYTSETSGDYPGWSPDPESRALALLQQRYQAMFGEAPKVVAGHGGLECGIIKAHYPEMDMISFGPTILGAHSPDERASVSSTQKFWGFLKDVLAHIP
ncbi:aminoacyl-histidine dipeptidase [Robiginitalea sp. M366]|uniref:aminoacyl-histidine dipeptidase n=1 Tax=Robiginitalea aestuariiviva TaxID=3036903 RepID=UPI00240D77D4|nr:aminoacyl-histidine dipeptidase [Robiginitalea aestuariiviva]MDG1573235.1 aminoacyl-histidine dipeptidase [Robiginitalea aestuariiviva]